MPSSCTDGFRLVRLHVVRLEDRCVPSAESAGAGLQFLSGMHDEFHTRFPVYDDVSSAGNHFVAVGFLPDQNAPVAVNGSWEAVRHSGATAIRNELRVEPGKPFGGVYFMNGLLGANGETLPNFGDTPNAGVTIPGPARLTFWARGQAGGERVEFFIFGVGRDPHTGAPTSPFPDSSARIPPLGTVTTLSAAWQQFSIDIPAGSDTSYVLGGFGWSAEVARNPGGALFFLDDIQYELTPTGRQVRENEPRFVRSYRTGPNQSVPGPAGDFDFVLRNSAFSYDNALAALAFLADRDPATRAESLRRARLIGDTFVYAATHDRRYTDGRLRTDYAAGDHRLFPGWLANGRPDTAPVAGFYDEAQQRFLEILQLNVDTGNNAWGMVALLGLYSRTNHQPYLDAARRVGEFILTQRNGAGLYQGFLAGINNADHRTLPPAQRLYASTEHNIDVYAAFTRMYEITGEEGWRDGAEHAWRFVEAMWEPGRGAFLAGTKDPNTRNADPGQLPLDVQAWAVLARPLVLREHPELLASIDAYFRVTEAGITGYDFNEDRDGVWSEGTAQAATAFEFAGDPARAVEIRQQLDLIRTHSRPPGWDRLGIPAALHNGLTTGFQTEEGRPFLYHNRLHTGATAWDVFAQLGFNPYSQNYSTDPVVVGGAPDGTGPVFHPRTLGEFFTTPAATLQPFGNTGTDVRPAVGDVNGDRVPDTVLVTGPGTPIRFAVVDGRDGVTLLVPPTAPFAGSESFAGGGFASAGDFDGDGRAEMVFTPDRGGGPRVTIFSLLRSGLVRRANFFGIADPEFRGGARSGAGDVNRDGVPDLAVAAGFAGGPRVALYDGTTVLGGGPTRLLGDFFAFEDVLRNGVYVAVGDVDGDGAGDLVFGAGPGGGPRVLVVSGRQLLGTGAVAAVATPLANFFVAGNDADRGGVRVATTNADGDNTADVVVGSGESQPARVRVYLGRNFGGGEPAPFQDLDPFGGAVLTDGVFVG